MSRRPSPTESANDNKNILTYGNDKNLWVSSPDKNLIYHWRKLNTKDILKYLYDKIQFKNKYNYTLFLNFYNNLKYANTLFYYHPGYIIHHLEFILDEYERIDINDNNNYRDFDGAFYKYNDNDDTSASYVVKNLFLNNPNINNIFIFNDLDLLYSIFTGVITIVGFKRLDFFNESDITQPKNYYEEVSNLFNQNFTIIGKKNTNFITISYNKSNSSNKLSKNLSKKTSKKHSKKTPKKHSKKLSKKK